MYYRPLSIIRFPCLTTLVTLTVFTSCANPKPYSRTGIVQQIEPGKDGYMASLYKLDGSVLMR
ncbi:hypothetical protein [Spirosoma sp.]|uniref:hypothetical protein n=1 Tax=Spirosoma sp. TaxID=1899569 RepID=UPI00260E5DFF|nr:hypothetical protein [Spirosoma sp.]MCX6216921.1 hypothetical protein [Spirosoma sp.]